MAQRGVISSAERGPTGDEGPVVSVIIICYNQARFLGDAIESVANQTRRADEIIVVDDGSTEDVGGIVARYPGVACVRQANAGPSSARNAGLRAARGRYVVFLDADDRLLPEALEAGITSVHAHPGCGWVSGRYRMIDADGNPLRSEARACVATDHYLELLRGNYIGMLASVLYRREILEEVNGFDAALRECEDYDLYLRIARRWPVHCHDRVVAEYRWHGANVSRQRRRMLRSAMRVLHAQRDHVRGNPPREAACAAGVRNWQRIYGDPVLAETLAGLRDPRMWRSAAGGLATLLRHYPQGLWSRFRDRVARATGPRGPRAYLP
jgi:glycosyltransferase involved in cell wall biosynthesis